jgi:hypothetical protein
MLRPQACIGCTRFLSYYFQPLRALLRHFSIRTAHTVLSCAMERMHSMSHKALYVPWSTSRQKRTELYQIQLINKQKPLCYLFLKEWRCVDSIVWSGSDYARSHSVLPCRLVDSTTPLSPTGVIACLHCRHYRMI